MTAKRHCGQVHSRRPSLGPPDKIGPIGLGELDGRNGTHQPGRLARSEAQIARPDLGHFAQSPQPGQRQRRAASRHKDHQQGRRQVTQQGADLLMAAAVLDHVIVVKHEDDPDRQPDQRVDQHRNHGSRDVRGPGPQRPQEVLAAELRAGSLESGHDVPPQPAGVIVTTVERQPCHRAAFGRGGSPLRQQRRLAEARGSIDEDQFRRRGPGQLPDQPGPIHPLRARARTAQLGFDGYVDHGARRGPAGARRLDAFRRPGFLSTPATWHILTMCERPQDSQGPKVFKMRTLRPWPCRLGRLQCAGSGAPGGQGTVR